MTNTKSKVMSLAWEIRRRNKQDFFGKWTVKSQFLTFSECSRLAWGLIKESLKGVREAISYHIDILRANAVGALRSEGKHGYTYRREQLPQ